MLVFTELHLKILFLKINVADVKVLIGVGRFSYLKKCMRCKGTHSSESTLAEIA